MRKEVSRESVEIDAQFVGLEVEDSKPLGGHKEV